MTFKNFLKEARNITPEQPNNNVFIVIGIPGAGKSTLLKNGLLNVDNIVLLTPDRWIELLSKKENIDITNPINTSDLYNRVINKHVGFANRVLTPKALSNFVIETLGRNTMRLKDILIRTKKKGMRIIAVLVHVDLNTAITNNQRRYRFVSKDIIIDAYNKIEKNFNYLIASPEVDEAWKISNNSRPSYQEFRTSNFIQRLK